MVRCSRKINQCNQLWHAAELGSVRYNPVTASIWEYSSNQCLIKWILGPLSSSWSVLSSQLCGFPLHRTQWHDAPQTVFFFVLCMSVGNSQPRSQMTSPLLLTSHLAPFHHERNHATTHFHLAYPLQGHGRLAPIPHFLLNKTPRSHHPLWVLEMLSLQHDYLNLALSSASVNINKPQNTIQG